MFLAKKFRKVFYLPRHAVAAMIYACKKKESGFVLTNKKTLLHWCGWFFLGNAILFLLIGLHYLPCIPWLDTSYLTPHGKIVVEGFIVLAYLGHLSLLAFFPCMVLIPLILIFPAQRRFVLPLAISIATLAATLLIIDTIAYQLYRFHLNGVVIDLIVHGLGKELLGLSWMEYVSVFGVVCGLVLGESLYAIWLWRFYLTKNSLSGFGKWIIIFLGMCLYISYGMIVYSQGYRINRIIVDVSRFLPLYTSVFGAILPVRDGRTVIECMSHNYLVQPSEVNSPLNYPLAPIKCKPFPHPLNVVLIVIDAWRADMLNPVVAPNLVNFSQKSWVFTHHFSGGNATGPGIFSLFYGLPLSYWTAMEAQHQGPVLINELLKQHYKMGIFGSATLTLPHFNKTVFSAIKNFPLDTDGNNPYERDQKITAEFDQFITHTIKESQPFFSFLFYDGVHGYCSYDNDLKPFQPAIENCTRMHLTNETNPLAYFNRYKNAIVLVDQQIKHVINTLEKNNLLNNTVVLITGDHGEEFNDNHLGYWSHASNFTPYQTQTPLIVYWPKKGHHVFEYRTSHFDIAPTLMQRVLGCKTLVSNFSSGKNLFDGSFRPYFIISSYVNFGIVEPDRITNIYATGGFRIDQINGKPSPQATLNIPLMKQVFQDLRRFYKS